MASSGATHPYLLFAALGVGLAGGCGDSGGDDGASGTADATDAADDDSTQGADDGADDGVDDDGSGGGSGSSSADDTASSDADASGSDGDSGSDDTGAGASSWHTLAPLPEGPRQETAVAALNGIVYVVAGFIETSEIVADVEAYDPAADAWSTVAPVPAALHHAHLAAHGDRLYLLGSLRGLGFGADGTSWSYDPAADAWTEVEPMPLITARGGGAAATIGEQIYVVGGLAGGQAVADNWSYEPEADTWLPLADLPTPRDHLGVAAVDGLLYAVGGRDGTIGGHTDRVDVYDPATDTWSDGPPMPTSRGGFAIGATATTIFVAGGEGNGDAESGVFDQLESLTPADGAWESLPVMPVPRHGMGGATVGATFYVPGGATVQALGAVADHEAWGP